jgi:uncharacterized protein (TIGR02300 family)
MATTKEARGTKRTCQNEDCEAKFYDLNRDPIVCPICDTVYKLAPELQEDAEVEEVAAAPVPAKAAAVADAGADGDEVADDDDALVSLEEADEELGDDDDDDDDTFLETDDDDPEGVSDIIGGGVGENDEET